MAKKAFCLNCGAELPEYLFLQQENAKLKQALEEIREITETITPYEVEDKRCLDKILNKINEVLNV